MGSLFGDIYLDTDENGKDVKTYQFNSGRLVGGLIYCALGAAIGLGVA